MDLRTIPPNSFKNRRRRISQSNCSFPRTIQTNTRKMNSLVRFSLLAIACLSACAAHHKGSHTKTYDIDESIFDDEDLLIEKTGSDKDFQAIDDSLFSAENYASDGTACARKDTDEYIDKVLDEVRPKLPDPADLPDRVGRFSLSNGTLLGLFSLKRVGPAMVRCTDSTYSFLVPLGLNNLSGGYNWELDTAFRPLKGGIDMVIRSVRADILYTRTQTPQGVNATVDKLTITRLDGIDVNFTGLGPLNRFVSRMTNLVARVFRLGISRMLEGPVRNAINKELRNVEKYEEYYY